jgi:large subunit ribosomal protein L2
MQQEIYFLMKKINKLLSVRLLNISGRNFLGRICVFHRGNGPKNLYTKLDFYKNVNAYGIIVKLYKYYRYTALVGDILYDNGLLAKSIMIEGKNFGDYVFSGRILKKKFKYDVGSSIPVKNINLFTKISNIELYPYSGTILVRAAGGKAMIVHRAVEYCTLKLKSGWLIAVSNNVMASIGVSSNSKHKEDKIGKAGNKRHLGFRPVVRGVAKNPCDHPHGGGRGKASPPVAARTP